METWFLNHVLGLSLSVLLLGQPGLLGAGTPSHNSTDPVTAGVNYSTATDEPNDLGNNATSASHFSESLSPSQRNILLSVADESHTAAAAGSLGKITVTEACDASGVSLVLLVCLIYLPQNDSVFSLQTKAVLMSYFLFPTSG